jgi:hypothetical protein
MKSKAVKLALSVSLILILVVNSETLRAQEATAALSGRITDPSGKVVANAKVSVRNSSTGQVNDTQSDSTGQYTVSKLVPGDYEVSASAEGFATFSSKLTLAAGSPQTLGLTLSSAPVQQVPAAPSANLPNAPSSAQTEPALEDLGFSKTEMQSNTAQQALLDKRTRMLKMHQRFGLITTVPLLATLIVSVNAGGKSTSTTSRDLHVALGAVTGDLYGITAYYAIRAPRISRDKKKGPIKFHEAMAWIHGPGMILTPILGTMAFNQKSNGEKVHGIASAHGPVAIVTAGAFGAALLSVSLKF